MSGNPISTQTASVRVSVCIPTYNGEAFIAGALKSVLAQSLGDFELIVVDDGSSDATVEVVRSITDPRIQLYHNTQRLGIPGNWNRCLSLARGEYLCLFHQDDEMFPENLARKVAMLAADPTISFVHSAVEVVVEDSAPMQLGAWIEKATEDRVFEGTAYFRKLLFEGDCICAPAVVARRQLLVALQGFNERLGYACDYEMWMKLCVEGRVAFLAQPFIRYRWHSANASHPYRFERGVEECLIAGRCAVQHYLERTGRLEERAILESALSGLAELKRWNAELERGKVWLEEQGQAWQQAAEEREHILQEQKVWMSELEKGKAWLDEQRVSWQKTAEEREKVVQAQQKVVQEQQAVITELERVVEWWKQQWRAWQQSVWGRLGVHLGALKLPGLPIQESDRSRLRTDEEGTRQ